MEGSTIPYEKEIRKYILEHVETTLKAPNSYLKHPFVDPGSVYDGNLWDWDTFWAVYALFNIADTLDSGLPENRQSSF